MSDKKNIITATLIFVLFFLLFPLKLVPNLNYNSADSMKLSLVQTPLSGEKIPYIYKNHAGYFTKDLEESWGVKIKDGITLLDSSFINSSRDKKIIQIRNFDGDIKFSIEDDGYPFSISDRLYVISRDRKSLYEIEEGRVKWSRSFNYIITSIDGNFDTTVIGFAKGFFTVLDSDGEITFDYEPGGSRVSIIYSVVISKDSKYIGIVSGLDPQRFILYERRGVEYKPYYTTTLKDEIRKSVKLFITSNNRSVFLQNSSGFFIINIEEKSDTFFESNYNLKYVEYLKELDIYLVHSGAVNYNNIKLLTPDNRVLLENNFIGEGVSVRSMNKSIYTVIDDSVIKLDIRE